MPVNTNFTKNTGMTDRDVMSVCVNSFIVLYSTIKVINK